MGKPMRTDSLRIKMNNEVLNHILFRLMRFVESETPYYHKTFRQLYDPSDQLLVSTLEIVNEMELSGYDKLI